MTPSNHHQQEVLTDEQIEEFLDQGVLVVPDILSPSELEEAREGLSRTLAQHGIDTNDLEHTGHFLQNLSSTNGSGGVLDLFYAEWKMIVASNPRLFRATCQLWEAAYCHQGESREELDDANVFMWHPYGPFDCNKGFMYVDRIGYRIPTTLAEKLGSGNLKSKKKIKPIQRSLTPHLDCCPDDFFSKSATKWRPIQCFVSLTDNLEPNTGGFEAAPGFHKTFHQWNRPKSVVRGREIPAPCIGEYAHIRPKEDCDVMKQIRHIAIGAGSAVFWDNRIPHANAYLNTSDQARAVVYCSFLPDIALNREYARQQLYKYRQGIPPNDQWINNTDKVVQPCSEDQLGDIDERSPDDTESSGLTPLARKLLGMKPW